MASPRRRPIPAATPGTVTDADEWDDIQTPCSAEPDMWFATDPDGVAYAKSICASCPMREACLRAAMEGGLDGGHGIWGGLDPDERRLMRRNTNRKSRASNARRHPCPVKGCERTFKTTQALGAHTAQGHSTHCRHDHAMTPDNVYWDRGSRRCLECARQASRAARARAKQAS